MALLQQEFDASGLPSLKPYLNYLIDRGHAEHVKVKRGKGERNVIIIEGKKYSYKGGHEINKNLKKKITSFYITMSDKSSNSKISINDNTKNDYRLTVKEQLEKLKTNSIQNVKIDLTKINIKNIGN